MFRYRGLLVSSKVYKVGLFQDVFAKHADLFKELHVNANNGLGDVYEKIKVGVVITYLLFLPMRIPGLTFLFSFLVELNFCMSGTQLLSGFVFGFSI